MKRRRNKCKQLWKESGGSGTLDSGGCGHETRSLLFPHPLRAEMTVMSQSHLDHATWLLDTNKNNIKRIMRIETQKISLEKLHKNFNLKFFLLIFFK